MPTHRGLSGTALEHEARARASLKLRDPSNPANAVHNLIRAAKAEAEAQWTRDAPLQAVARRALQESRQHVQGMLRRQRRIGFEGLGRTEFLHTRGYKDGKKSWIDVMPVGGPKMRVTHEILEGVFGSIPPPVPPKALRKCIAWRYVGTSRRCAIFADETGFRTAKPPVVPPKGMHFGGIFG